MHKQLFEMHEVLRTFLDQYETLLFGFGQIMEKTM